MDKDLIKNKTQEFLDKIFELSSVQYKLEMEFKDEEGHPDQLFVNIKSTDDNILIGYHGNTLKSLQHILDNMIFREFQENIDVILDVGDYRAERKKKIVEVADSAIEKARSFKKAIALYPMSSYERKIVHERISETEDLVSSSEGEGRERRVIISFKDQN